MNMSNVKFEIYLTFKEECIIKLLLNFYRWILTKNKKKRDRVGVGICKFTSSINMFDLIDEDFRNSIIAYSDSLFTRSHL